MNALKLPMVFISGFVVAYVWLGNAPQEHKTNSAVHTLDASSSALSARIAELEETNLNLREQVAVLALPVASNDVAPQPVNSVAKTETSNDQLVVPVAEIKNNLHVFSVQPVLFSLSNQLQLDESQNNELEQLLTTKAQADFDAWQTFNEHAEAEPDNRDYYQQLYMDAIAQNSAQYQRSLENKLTAQQLTQYKQYERAQAKLNVQQKLSMLNNSLTSLNLNDFQKQEIKRLSAQVYSVADAIALGTSGSPYANTGVNTDFEKLAQIRALFSEEQQRKLNL
ncbi:hypothetical protein HG263_11990 [Pseudoalteromonas sp. JBTF-M23]|uniref:Uncharacterized protein n=1 Tax=Pseudoalteromonas caenipelagi TaxID=2726988 RepID=A0A849VEP7_9GAMM|nr:hypothetical protein [Pseudoalteromonas caenipelagi]NOU51248.1 hypothetical protein [Pseudoalteromonas caenipelagi]